MKKYMQARREWLASYLREALNKTNGNANKAAKLIGVNRTHFYKLCRRAGVYTSDQRVRGNAEWQRLAELDRQHRRTQ